MTQVGNTFDSLDIANAKIDVWIDEENYTSVNKYLAIDDPQVKQSMQTCFVGSGRCVNRSKGIVESWQTLIEDRSQLPIISVDGMALKEGDEVDGYWSRLFYAKLLRAYIQRKGTDCYFHLLDEVVTYLENNLPRAKLDNEEVLKLIVIYRLELAAAANPSEQLGFARRAEARLRNPNAFGTNGGPFCRFYRLWAKYNVGLAHFHEAQYKNAVLAFNGIICEIQKCRRTDASEEDKEFLGFFERHEGDRLLFLPAIMYRSDVQLKLQLAYHALETLTEEDYRKRFDDRPYKQVRRDLILADAYQQLGRLDMSWAHLKSACDHISKMIRLEGNFPARASCEVPQCLVSKKGGLQTLKMRSLDIFIEDHLNWLMARGIDLVEPRPTLASLVGTGSQKDSYLAKLAAIFSGSYRSSVRENVENRQGYYLQLADLLSWMTAQLHSGDLRTEGLPARTKVIETARKLREHGKRGWLGGGRRRQCNWCEPEDILPHIYGDHFDSFTKDLRDFYKRLIEEGAEKDETLIKEKDRFVRRLVAHEHKEMGALHYQELDLCYDSREIMKDIEAKTNDCPKLCFGGVNEKAFAKLLTCVEDRDEAQSSGQRGDDNLTRIDYQHILNQWGSNFLRHLTKRSWHESHDSGLYFMGLRRWNSSSPAKGRSVGGGYLLYHIDPEKRLDLGIAIDPGFDFLRNLFHCGFSLDDIDIVLISHAHMDHVRDFEAIVLLLLELSARANKERRIHAIMTLGVYQRLKHIFSNPRLRSFVEPYIIDIKKEIDEDYWETLNESVRFRFVRSQGRRPTGAGSALGSRMYYQAVMAGSQGDAEWRRARTPKMEIVPTRAYHNDYTDVSDSFGFLISLKCPQKKEVRFGYTGDTKWVYPGMKVPVGEEQYVIRDIAEQYGQCDAILVHLGSLIDIDKGKRFEDYDQRRASAKECENLVRNKNHPYLVGVLRLLTSIHSATKTRRKKPLILLSEFGEELGGSIRKDLAERINVTYDALRAPCLPVDVGMDVLLHRDSGVVSESNSKEPTVWCVQCGEFVKTSLVDFVGYGVDEAIYCVCKTCRKSTPQNVLQSRLSQLYDLGRELRT